MKTIHTDKAPKAIGPYSQAVVVGNLVFCSGQIGFDPKTGDFVPGGIKEQTEQVLENLEAVVEAAGGRRQSIVSVNVYLRSMQVFPLMNEVYAAFFGDHKPARATIGVSELPKNALVEMSCIASLNS